MADRWRIRRIQQEGRKITIKPIACKELSHAKAVYDSPVGRIESGWKYEGDKITFEFVIPVNTVAEVVLPNGEKHGLLPECISSNGCG